MPKKRKGLPQGVNYAQVLAEEKRKKDLQARVEHETELQIHAEIFVQRALWLSIVSIADAYGYGPKRLEPYFEKLKENGDEFDQMCEDYDYDYALEKLRQKAEKVTGAKLEYKYERELQEYTKKRKGG